MHSYRVWFTPTYYVEVSSPNAWAATYDAREISRINHGPIGNVIKVVRID